MGKGGMGYPMLFWMDSYPSLPFTSQCYEGVSIGGVFYPDMAMPRTYRTKVITVLCGYPIGREVGRGVFVITVLCGYPIERSCG